MSTVNNSDSFYVQRGENPYKVSAENLMAIKDDDLMLVSRGGVSYKATGADIKASIGGGDNPTIKKTARGLIRNGDPVVDNGDNTVSSVTGTRLPNGLTDFVSDPNHVANGTRNFIGWNPVHNLWLYTFTGPGNRPYVVTGFPQADGSVTFGTSVQLDPSVCNGWVGAWYPPSNQFQIATRSDGAGAGITHRLLTQDADGTITISNGAGSGYGTNLRGLPEMVYVPDLQKCVVAYAQAGSAPTMYVKYHYIGDDPDSGRPTVTSAQTEFLPNYANDISLAVTTGQQLVLGYARTSGQDEDIGVWARPIIANGSNFVEGSDVMVQNRHPAQYTFTYYDSIQDKVLFVYRIRQENSGTNYFTYTRVATVSSNSVNFLGEPNLFDTGIIEDWQAAYNPYYGRFDCFYAIKYSSSSDASFFGNFVIQGSTTPIQESVPISNDGYRYYNAKFGGSPTKETACVFRYYNEASQNTYAASTYLGVLGNSNLDTHNFLGFADGQYTDGQECKVHTQGAVNEAQSGLVEDNFYYCLADGSLDTIGEAVPVRTGTALSATSIKVQLN